LLWRAIVGCLEEGPHLVLASIKSIASQSAAALGGFYELSYEAERRWYRATTKHEDRLTEQYLYL
jgi:hypothetical protein